jgi:hypothetical protein
MPRVIQYHLDRTHLDLVRRNLREGGMCAHVSVLHRMQQGASEVQRGNEVKLESMQGQRAALSTPPPMCGRVRASAGSIHGPDSALADPCACRVGKPSSADVQKMVRHANSIGCQPCLFHQIKPRFPVVPGEGGKQPLRHTGK